jgi:hypothetical protein
MVTYRCSAACRHCLVMAEANHAHVLALVCRQVDKMMAATDRPGTTIETKLRPLSSTSGFVDEAKLQTIRQTKGPLAAYRYLGEQRQALVDRISKLNQWMLKAALDEAEPQGKEVRVA